MASLELTILSFSSASPFTASQCNLVDQPCRQQMERHDCGIAKCRRWSGFTSPGFSVTIGREGGREEGNPKSSEILSKNGGKEGGREESF